MNGSFNPCLVRGLTSCRKTQADSKLFSLVCKGGLCKIEIEMSLMPRGVFFDCNYHTLWVLFSIIPGNARELRAGAPQILCEPGCMKNARRKTFFSKSKEMGTQD